MDENRQNEFKAFVGRAVSTDSIVDGTISPYEGYNLILNVLFRLDNAWSLAGNDNVFWLFIEKFKK